MRSYTRAASCLVRASVYPLTPAGVGEDDKTQVGAPALPAFKTGGCACRHKESFLDQIVIPNFETGDALTQLFVLLVADWLPDSVTGGLVHPVECAMDAFVGAAFGMGIGPIPPWLHFGVLPADFFQTTSRPPIEGMFDIEIAVAGAGDHPFHASTGGRPTNRSRPG